ncbi:hypothetical protein DPMN_024881 [Dreissena polymorpha]|uniref:Uncharacterized protein n=1 Tax=Dreissena polymorpha TaxID=45954 RepID=A0A9D4LQH3_DREPO|nr:hypothetical protein DPMN_024881 [Dreissena polymorpha]
MPAKTKRTVRVGLRVKNRSSRAASSTDGDGEQQQRETVPRSRSRSLSPSQDLHPPPTENVPQKKRKASIALKEEQEVDMADWLKEHPMLCTMFFHSSGVQDLV